MYICACVYIRMYVCVYMCVCSAREAHLASLSDCRLALLYAFRLSPVMRVVDLRAHCSTSERICTRGGEGEGSLVCS